MGHTLLLSTKAEEESKDDTLAALSRIAYASPTPIKEPVSKPKKKKLLKKKKAVEPEKPRFHSRFFYRPTQSLADEVEDRRTSMERRQIEERTALDIVNEEVIKRSTTYSAELPPQLKSEIDKVREFWLSEMGPKLLASNPGTLQALDVMQHTIDGPVQDPAFAQFERMLEHARMHKMANFIVQYMGLPKNIAADLIHAVTPKKEVMIVGPQPFDNNRPPQRHERNAEARRKAESKSRPTEPDNEES